MSSFISRDGSYHEGDGQVGDVVVPQRPDYTYIWNGSAWVQDPALKAEADEIVRLQTEKTSTALIPEVALLLNATPTQIDTWFANNVTTVASARAALIILTKIVAILGRQVVK